MTQHDMIKKMWKSREAIDIIENPLVSMWMKEKAKRDPLLFCRLIENNLKRYSRWLGSGAKVEESGYIVWMIKDVHLTLLIGCSVKNGTVFKVLYPAGISSYASDRKFGGAVNASLEKISQKLSGQY